MFFEDGQIISGYVHYDKRELTYSWGKTVNECYLSPVNVNCFRSPFLGSRMEKYATWIETVALFICYSNNTPWSELFLVKPQAVYSYSPGIIWSQQGPDWWIKQKHDMAHPRLSSSHPSPGYNSVFDLLSTRVSEGFGLPNY